MRTLSVLLCVNVILFSQGYGTPMYDTIVVGLGAAGTAAASTLAKAGRKVLALEAQGRIGGRVYTVPFGDGLVELGAEWIHGTDPSPVYDIAIKNNISILPQDLDFEIRFSDGVADKKEVINELTAFALQAVEDPPENPEPLGQYLSRRIREHIKTNYPTIANDTEFINAYLDFLDLLIDNYESSNSWNDVTTQSKYTELGGHQHMSWNKHGYKTLFELLLNTYNNGPGHPTLEVKLSTEVTRIQWPQDPKDNVLVTVKDGSTFTARNVIVTLSIGVLKERHESLFKPPLPQSKSQVIKAIAIGVVGKIVLRFDDAFWPKDAVFFGFIWKDSDRKRVPASDWWTMKIFGASCPMGNQKALTIWTSGNGAKLVESLPDEVVRTKVMGVVRKFMGADRTIPEPVEMLRTYWQTNPYTRGSYTYDNVDTPKHPRARSELAAPLADAAGEPRLLFAGEATDTTHFSTVHGAVESGFREAKRLLPASKI